MKSYLKVLIISFIIVFLVNLTIFHNEYTAISISNSFFVVGLTMFFLGLMSVTDASKIFLILNYSFKSAFRKNYKYQTFYDYAIDKQKKKLIPYALQVLIIGTVYVIISLILNQFVTYNLT